jgi:hypothetical protein
MRVTISIALLIATLTVQLSASGTSFGPYRSDNGKPDVEMAWSNLETSAGSYAQQDAGSESRKLSPRMRLLLGALVPGLPQFLDGRPRAYAYFAVEGFSIGALFTLNSRGNSYLDRYKTLALTARNNFVYPGLRNNPTEDVDLTSEGYGEYYEDLLKWTSSGDYDNDPNQTGVQPETDPRTYNGHQWEIAKINNYTGSSGGIPVPASQAEADAAMQSYLQRVYLRELNWDWTGLDEENEEYHRLFDVSERAYRNRNNFVAVLLANHLVSVIDVLITERLNRSEVMRSNGVSLGVEIYMPQGYSFTESCPMLTVSRGF